MAERRQRLEARAAVIAPSWEHYLNGLWLSGLRLKESLELSWDDEGKLCVDLSGEHPTLQIPAELEKGHRDRLWPIAPEFAEFLLETPEGGRTGYVFNPQPRREDCTRLLSHRVGEVVATIGESAGVKVHVDPYDGEGKVRQRPRPAAKLRRTLVGADHAHGPDGSDAAREHRNDDAVLRGSECPKHGKNAVGGPQKGRFW